MDTNETEMEKEFLNFCKKKKIKRLSSIFLSKPQALQKEIKVSFYPRQNSRTAKSIMYIKFMKPTN